MKYCYLKLQDGKIVCGELVAENNKEYILNNCSLREDINSKGSELPKNRVPKMAVVCPIIVDREESVDVKDLSDKEKWEIEMNSLVSCTLDSFINFSEDSDLSLVTSRIISNIKENSLLSGYIPND